MNPETLKIKISIADRIYPLTITYDQEEAVRKAAKKIEGMLKELEANFAVRDKQDLLAMCALELATRDLQSVQTNFEDYNNTLNLLKKMNSDLDQIL
ncbi:cell division protein ZapA [Flavobacterium agricola]|uniref:Cell division protein ZapA n=1 Tax=Flavobacterium agricola TaxID=2870839 RepID=A0ABY6M2M8_9FLAO|nr:cell division protein ZapA [Flavobacterium agricola]UYW01558.1 cell division protein ZapA [Flavobacterium agricola]